MSKERKWEKAPQELVDLFYSVMERFPDAELRKMFGYPCAFYNGNMFVGLHERNMAVRLEKGELEKAFESGSGREFAPMKGRVMREYLALGEEVLADPEKVAVFVEKSMAYVKTLPRKVKKSKKK